MHMNHAINIVELQHIFFKYEKGVYVLHDISLDIHKGDYLGIIGPNGGGKTTLIKIMLNLLHPEKGSVKLFGQHISSFKDWYKIGYVPQKAVNFENSFPLSVEEVVNMGRYGRKGMFKNLDNHDKHIIVQSLKHVEMEHTGHKLIGNLSGGQQQRVFIARALASEPEIIVLDEPTAGVDEKTHKQFYDLLKKLNKELKLTLILVTHDMNIVSHEASEIVCINKTAIYDRNPKMFIQKNQFHNH